MNKFIFFLIIVCCNTSLIKSQETDSIAKGSEAGFFPLPVVYYTPETRFGFGAVALYSFRFNGESDSSRNSQFQFGGAYTQEDQLLFYLPFQLYHSENKYNFFGELGYYKYSYFFFGTGNDVPIDYEELYHVNFPRVRLNATQLIAENFYFGLRYWLDDYRIVNTQNGKLLDKNTITGSNGGVVSSLGLIGLLDSRDNYNYPTKGAYAEFLALPNLKLFGSDFEFMRLSMDYVQFIPLKPKSTLALNLFAVANVGEPPFNELAFIGGRGKMRGYYEGKFRDRNLLMSQLEFRQFLFWKIGLVAFAGTGVVNRHIDQMAIGDLKLAGGLGLRFQLDPKEKINIRLDYGIGENNSSGVYLTIGEAF